MYWHDSRQAVSRRWLLFLLIFCLLESRVAWPAQNVWIRQAVGLGAGSVYALAIDPMTPNTLYAGTNLLLTSVAGLSAISDDGGVFKSTDAGVSWFATGLTKSSVSALAINTLAPTILHAGIRGGVAKSVDAGAAWATVDLPTNPEVAALAIHPSAPNTIYAGTYRAGVFKSIDGGVKWVASNAGLTNIDVRTLAIDPLAPNILYAGTSGGGVFKSTNDGTTWAAVNTGLTNMDARVLVINPKSTDMLYVGTGGGGVFKSMDGGITWRSANTGLPVTPIGKYNYVYSLAINPTTPTTLYTGTNFDGVFKSVDGGLTWANIGLTSNPVLALAINPATPAIVYAGTLQGGVFRYEDACGLAATISDSDRIFNYLEARYPQYLAPAQAASATTAGYCYRYYSGTKAYIATSKGMVYYLGPVSGNSIYLVGAQADLLDAAKQLGF